MCAPREAPSSEQLPIEHHAFGLDEAERLVDRLAERIAQLHVGCEFAAAAASRPIRARGEELRTG